MFDGRTKYAEAIAIYESVGAERDAATALTNVADAEFGCGNVDEAAQLGTRSLIAKRQISSKTAIALQLVNLARYCIAAGRWMVARGSAHEAVHLTKDIQHHLNFPLSLQRVAFLAALSLREPGGDPRATANSSAAPRLFRRYPETPWLFARINPTT